MLSSVVQNNVVISKQVVQRCASCAIGGKIASIGDTSRDFVSMD